MGYDGPLPKEEGICLFKDKEGILPLQCHSVAVEQQGTKAYTEGRYPGFTIDSRDLHSHEIAFLGQDGVRCRAVRLLWGREMGLHVVRSFIFGVLNPSHGPEINTELWYWAI